MKQKPKICKVCGKEFKPMRITPVCSYICALKFNDEKEVNKRIKQIKTDLKKVNYNDILQTQINLIVRLIDKGHSCITSDIPYGRYRVAAGHFYSIGSNPTLRFNLLNIFAQSFSDNDYKGGKGSNYSLRLKEIFGVFVRDEIEYMPSKYKTLHLIDDEKLQAIINAKEIVKELKAVDRIYTTEERIILRREYNERIGIYK